MNLNDLVHLHLLLNHVPTIGGIIAMGLYIVALLTKSVDLKRMSLVLLVGVALVTLCTYVTGNAAQKALEHSTMASKTLIRTHEGAALMALAMMELTGAFAWLGLWQLRRFKQVANWNTGLILILSLVTMGVVTRAANIGGEIRHPETSAVIAPAAGGDEIATPEKRGVAEPAEWPLARQIGLQVVGSPWGWPSLETLHFIGLTLLIGVILLIDLRMLGVMKNVSFATLHRLLPWAILGFGINVLTGMLFFVASPDQYDTNVAFHWKLALIMIAGLNALYFTVLDEAWVIKPGDEAPFTAKFAAVSAIVLWIGVLYFGSMLPFIGNAF